MLRRHALPIAAIGVSLAGITFELLRRPRSRTAHLARYIKYEITR